MDTFKDRAKKCIAQGALTNSKHWDRYPKYYPTHILRGEKNRLILSNGQYYQDFIGALGANILGYDNPSTVDTIAKYSSYGQCHSLPTEHEVLAAELVKGYFPCIEQLKFVNDGSSACTAALRIARSFTGKKKIISSGYHGWHDEFISLVDPATGINRDQFTNILKDDQILEADLDDVAAVIIEPVMLDDSRARIQWLEQLRTKCNMANTLLIFDEIITGGRYPKLSVANFYSINPDIILLGKAIGNGAKIAVVGGRKKVMESDYFCSGTYHGEIISLNVMMDTLRNLKTNWKFDPVKLKDQSEAFMFKFNQLAPEFIKLVGWGARCAWEGDPSFIAKFCQQSVKMGYIFHPSTVFFNSHDIEEFDNYLELIKEVIKKCKDPSITYHGKYPTSPFSAKLREPKK